MSRPWMLTGWLSAIALALACAPARPPLPPAPPVQSATELTAWQQAPALQAEPEVRLQWGVKRSVLPNGLGVTIVARPESETSAVYLRVPSAADRSNGAVAAMAEALRAGSFHGRKAEVYVNPKIGSAPIWIGTDSAGTTFSWSVLPRATHTALELLGEFVLKPAFDAEEVKIRLQQELASIQRQSVILPWHAQRLARAAHARHAFPRGGRARPVSAGSGAAEANPRLHHPACGGRAGAGGPAGGR